MLKTNKPETKIIYVIKRPYNHCWLDEIFYSRKQAVKYRKKIKDNEYKSYNYYRKLKIKKIVLKSLEEMKNDKN